MPPKKAALKKKPAAKKAAPKKASPQKKGKTSSSGKPKPKSGAKKATPAKKKAAPKKASPAKKKASPKAKPKPKAAPKKQAPKKKAPPPKKTSTKPAAGKKAVAKTAEKKEPKTAKRGKYPPGFEWLEKCEKQPNSGHDTETHGFPVKVPKEGEWTLFDCVEAAKAHPDTFQIPRQEHGDVVEEGDLLKIIIDGGDGLERLHCQFCYKKDGKFYGHLANQPVLTKAVQLGDVVQFEWRHVATVFDDRLNEGWGMPV